MLQKKFFIALVLCILFLNGKSQVTCYRVYFTDKQNSPYSIQRPEEYLSERAIAKRTRFQIPITETDLPVNPAYVAGVLSTDEQISVFSKSKWTNTITIYCPNSAALISIGNLPYVNDIVPVATYQLLNGKLPPTNAVKQERLADSCNYGESLGQLAVHNGQRLHEAGYHGEGMLIAVLDGGWEGFNAISRFRPLYDNGQIWGERDILPTNNIYEGHVHGTYVTSIMASHIEDSLIGTAPAANYYFIRTENPWSEQPIEEDFWATGAELADSIGADVINSSLGYSTFDDDSTFHFDYSFCDGETSIASLAATMAAERGIIVCVSAGNEAMNEWHYIGRPADAKGILAVGAIDKDSLYAPFSSTGPSYDQRVKPDVASVGWNTIVMSPGDSIIPGNGTSFASPVIAGLSACLWQALPQKSAIEMMDIIRQSAHQYNAPDSLMGYGIPNFYQAYLDNYEPDTTAIQDYSLTASRFDLYPNPCGETCIILNPDAVQVEITIFDITGKVMQHRMVRSGNTQIILNVSDLSDGLYLIGIADLTGYREIKKVVKK